MKKRNEIETEIGGENGEHSALMGELDPFGWRLNAVWHLVLDVVKGLENT